MICRFYGSTQNAIGKRFHFEQGTPLMEIIGVAKSGLYRSLYEDYQPYMFLPVYQQQHGAVTILISAKCAADLPAVTASAWS